MLFAGQKLTNKIEEKIFKSYLFKFNYWTFIGKNTSLYENFKLFLESLHLSSAKLWLEHFYETNCTTILMSILV